MYTIHKHLVKENIDHPIANLEQNGSTKIKILFIGDINHSRTISSLFNLLVKFGNIIINFLPYAGTNPTPAFITKIIENNFYEKSIIFSKKDVNISEYDIIYVTRLQKERISEELNTDFYMNKSIMKKVKHNAIIMHPLPRNEEISPSIDNDPRCVYFKQMEYGIQLRMAILKKLLI